MSASSPDGTAYSAVMQSEIRKLKLELLKQELDDKLLTLKAHLEKKKLANSNLTTTTANPILTEDRQYHSILFVPVFWEFQVWHLVILVFIIWILISKMNLFISFLRKINNFFFNSHNYKLHSQID